ncbi:MAG: FG-GAP repeat domain-containing protein [Planctomycetaceae bacterium]
MSVRTAFAIWLGLIGLSCGAALAEESPPRQAPLLRERWRTPLQLHSPTNVVIGRIEGAAYFGVQGTAATNAGRAAGIELLNVNGKLVWQESHREEQTGFLPGAYVQWVDAAHSAEARVLYSFVPDAQGRNGGARLLRAHDGALQGEIANSTQFGNNNSLLADLDGDGRTELVYADQKTLTCFDLGELTQRWRCDTGVHFCWSLPALADLNADGKPEIVFGSEYNNADGSSAMMALDGRGKEVWRSDGHAEDLGSTPVFIGDVDGDGEQELIKVGLDLEHRRKQKWNHVHVFSRGGKLVVRNEFGCTGIALADYNGDGKLDGAGITNTRDGGNSGRRAIRCIDLHDGRLVWETAVERAYLDTNSPVAADLDGDGKPEAIVGTGNPAGYARLPNSDPWGDLYVVATDGTIMQRVPLPGWPVNCAFCDIDSDGLAELTVVIDGTPGWLAVYDTAAKTTRKDWPTPFGDASRRGTQFTR